MRRLCLLGALCVMGCGSVMGPFAPRPPQRVDDPLLPITEQMSRGRDRYSLPDESQAQLYNLPPRTYADRPSPSGR